MNHFIIESIQSAISFLPFLICFTMMFRRKVGKYWVLPMIALAGNIAYRVYELYLVRYTTDVFVSQELVIAFAPSMINLVLFFGLLSIQISQLREDERSAPEAMKLLEGPRQHKPRESSPSREAVQSSPAVRRDHAEAVTPDTAPAGEKHSSSQAQVSPALMHQAAETPRESVEQHKPSVSESGPVKKKPLEAGDLNQRIAHIRVPDDPMKREQMVRHIQTMKGSLHQVLELAQYNGQLKKPRKKKKPAAKRARKASA